MGFKVSIDASEKIELGAETVTSVVFNTDTPNDSNARSTDLGMGLTISGKIRANIGGVADDSVKLPAFALTPAEDQKCYANVTVEVISAGKVVRQVTMDTAYVVAYNENFSDESGVGTFTIQLRQKKDKNDSVSYQGGFAY